MQTELLRTFMSKSWYGQMTSFLLGKIPNNGMIGPYGKGMFHFSRTCQVVLQSGCTISYSHDQCVGAVCAPHPHLH